MHGGAEAARVNVFLADAGEDELVAVGANQIEPHPAVPRCHEPPVDQVALVSCGGESIDEIRADFIAADTDCRPNRHDKVRGLAAELPLHFLDGRHPHARRGSAPTGMYGGDRAGPRVGNQQRDAIGGAHHEGNIRCIRDDRVGLWASVVHGFERLG